MKGKILKITSASLIVWSLLASPLLADFNPNFIISDQEFNEYNSLSQEQIQSFLDRKGALGSYAQADISGIIKVAAQIIFEAALNYKINPKVLLVLLQKEQSLVEDLSPIQDQYDWATGFAVCDDCSKSDPRIQAFKGFGKQVDRAAWRFRYYFEHPEEFNYRLAETAIIDGHIVTPLNQGTANLYIYTPHWNGNLNFWRIWQKYFTKSYPHGSLLQARGETGVWLIEGGTRRLFTSKIALVSRYDPKNIIQVDQVYLDKYEIGRPIKYPEYALLGTPEGEKYLLAQGKARRIESNEVFRRLGFNPEEVIEATKEEILDYPAGEPITFDDAYPTGALLQDVKTGAVFYVQDGKKYLIIDRSLLSVNFPNWRLIKTSDEELKNYPAVGFSVLKDGILVKNPAHSAVYVISGGKKRPILSAKVFESLGYKWENIYTVPEKVLDLHEMGEMIEMVE